MHDARDGEGKMKKLLLISVFLAFSTLVSAQQAQTIYSSGTAYLSQECPQGSVAVLTVDITWKDLSVSQGGTGRKIMEEAVFAGKEGEKEIKFTGVRITPSFTRGEISLNVQCEIKKGDTVAAKFKIDESDESNPKPMSCGEAISGKLLNLKVKMKAAD
jgi:hypothetical protein